MARDHGSLPCPAAMGSTVHTHLLSGHGKGRIEPLFKGAAALEDGGQKEVEERPELRKLVLQWCARQQQAAGGHIVCVEDLGQLAVVVLHAVAFIHDHILPTDLQAQGQVVSGGEARGCPPLIDTLTAIRHGGSTQKSP